MTNGPLAPMTSRTDPVKASAASEPAAPSDRDLLDRFHRLRDQAAFEQLVRRHGPMVLSVCPPFLLHPNTAEHPFQSTFFFFFQKSGPHRDPELLANYLY